jgi:hypothetical protein
LTYRNSGAALSVETQPTAYVGSLATGRLVERGEAVGVIEAQSIGEPGTS